MTRSSSDSSTASPRRRPDLFILGAPKAGTTALAQYLSGHPDVFMSSPKEPGYFIRHLYRFDRNFGTYAIARTEAEYLALFASGAMAQIVGEASVGYLASAQALAEINAFSPNAKYIVMVRNPLEIAQAWHAQKVYEGEETEIDFERAWRLQARRAEGLEVPACTVVPANLQYGHIAMLGRHAQTLLGHVPRSRVHFVLFDDFVRDTASAYAQVTRFLGLRSEEARIFPKVNENRAIVFPRLWSAVRRPPRAVADLKVRLKAVLGRPTLGVIAALQPLLTRRAKRAPLPAALEAELRAYFRNDIATLETILDRRVGHWLTEAREATL